MAERTIEQQVKKLMTGLTSDQRPYLESFLAGLADRQSKAESAFVSGLFLFGGLWAASYLVSKGFVDEVTRGGLKLSHVQDLLIAVPPILGFVSYSLSAALTAAMVLEEVVEKIYVEALPTLGETTLKTLFWSHTFIGVEQHDVVTTRSTLEDVLSTCVRGGIVFFCWLLSLVAIIHVVHLANNMNHWPLWAPVLSGAVGCLFWFRGAVMIYHRTA